MYGRNLINLTYYGESLACIASSEVYGHLLLVIYLI